MKYSQRKLQLTIALENSKQAQSYEKRRQQESALVSSVTQTSSATAVTPIIYLRLYEPASHCLQDK